MPPLPLKFNVLQDHRSISLVRLLVSMIHTDNVQAPLTLTFRRHVAAEALMLRQVAKKTQIVAVECIARLVSVLQKCVPPIQSVQAICLYAPFHQAKVVRRQSNAKVVLHVLMEHATPSTQVRLEVVLVVRMECVKHFHSAITHPAD